MNKKTEIKLKQDILKLYSLFKNTENEIVFLHYMEEIESIAEDLRLAIGVNSFRNKVLNSSVALTNCYVLFSLDEIIQQANVKARALYEYAKDLDLEYLQTTFILVYSAKVLATKELKITTNKPNNTKLDIVN